MIDLTLPWHEEMLIFPGHPSFEPEALAEYETDGKRLSYFSANAHQGTHVDAPAHFVEDGVTIDEVDLDRLNGTTYVADLREHAGEPLEPAMLEAALPALDPGSRVLLATGDIDVERSHEAFFEEAAHITPASAEWLVEQDVAMVANDCMTEDVPGDPARPVHNTILGAGIPILEYLCNTDPIADRETVDLCCLPLSIPGFEAAPARAVVRG
jgi:kynurenine formamidase